MTRLVVVGLGTALVACGRFDFEPRRDAGGVIALDAVELPCGVSASAPDMVTMAGRTIEYQTFANASVPVAGVTVRAIDGDTLATVGETTSDANGDYAVSAPTGGAARRLGLQFEATGFFVTNVVRDLPIAADTMGAGMPRWTYGDGPVWDSAGMAAIYNAAGATRDPARGFINVAVRDCAGASIDGVTVAFDPAPAVVRYQTMSGMPAVNGPTQLPFAHVFALNAPAGRTRITATKTGRTFLETEVMVVGGQVNTLTIVRAVD